MTETRRRQFVIQAETYYADTSKQHWEPGTLAVLRLGLDAFTPDGHYDGNIGEWSLIWREITDGWVAIQLRAHDDSWKAFTETGFHEVMAELGTTEYRQPSATLEEVTRLLIDRGWVDATERVAPGAPAKLDGKAQVQIAAPTLDEALDEARKTLAELRIDAVDDDTIAELDRVIGVIDHATDATRKL